MKALFVFADNPGVDRNGVSFELNTSYWRCLIPAMRLKQAGHETLSAHLSQVFSNTLLKEVADFLHTAEVIVVERVFVNDFLDKIREWKSLGKKVVGTFDDAYHLIDPNSESGKFWRAKKTGATTGNLSEFRRNLSEFDRVIVPSHLLVEDYRPYCKDIRYVANYTLPELWQDIRKRPPDNNIVIGWGGSSGHVRSWRDSGIIGALARLQQKYPRMVVRVYGGGTEIPDYLKSTGVRCEFENWQPFESWPNHIAMMDIGVAPLSGPYDERRSSIKALEYGMASVPFVASDGAPYKDTKGGYLAKDGKDWYWALDTLIQNLGESREELARQGHEWALAHTTGCVLAYEQALGEWQ